MSNLYKQEERARLERETRAELEALIASQAAEIERLTKAIGGAHHPDTCHIWGPSGKTPYTVEQWALDGECNCWKIDAAKEKA